MSIDTGLDTIFTTSASSIKFGVGATNELGYELKKLGVKNALIITDKTIMELGLAEKVKAIIEARLEQAGSETRLYHTHQELMNELSDAA